MTIIFYRNQWDIMSESGNLQNCKADDGLRNSGLNSCLFTYTKQEKSCFFFCLA